MKTLLSVLAATSLVLSLGACTSDQNAQTTPSASASELETIESTPIELQDAQLDEVFSDVLVTTAGLVLPDYSSERAANCNIEILLSSIQSEMTDLAQSCIVDAGLALTVLTPDITVRIDAAVDALERDESGSFNLSDEYVIYRNTFAGIPRFLTDLSETFFVSCEPKNIVDPDFSAAEGENCETVVFTIMSYVQVWNTTRLEYFAR